MALSGVGISRRDPGHTGLAAGIVVRVLALALTCVAGYWIWRGAAPESTPLEALSRESSSPWRWCDAGEELFGRGDTDKARYCLQRALRLGPHIPSIWVRAANLYYLAGDAEVAVSCWAHALNTVSDFDQVVFSYFDQLAVDPLPALEDRARQSYFMHLLEQPRPQRAEGAWPRIRQTDALAVRYSSYLADQGNPRRAAEAWARYKHAPPRPIFNGSFEEEPRGGRFDWTIRQIEGAEAARDSSHAYDGKWSLRIRFTGHANLAFRHVSEAAYVSGGRYRFRAMVKTQDLTTDQGIRFEIGPVLTDAVGGTHDWTRMEAEMELAEGLVMVKLRREISYKFDNKISGTVWVDAISLDRL